EHRAQRVDLRLGARIAPAGCRFEAFERVGEREREALGDERAEAAREAGQLLQSGGCCHRDLIVTDTELPGEQRHCRPRNHAATKQLSRRDKFRVFVLSWRTGYVTCTTPDDSIAIRFPVGSRATSCGSSAMTGADLRYIRSSS